MSALGQKQTSEHLQPMSALPPKADIALHRSECPLCAKSGHLQCNKETPLFDHLVGGGDQRLRDGQTKRLCGLEIDHKLELGWLFDW